MTTADAKLASIFAIQDRIDQIKPGGALYLPGDFCVTCKKEYAHEVRLSHGVQDPALGNGDYPSWQTAAVAELYWAYFVGALPLFVRSGARVGLDSNAHSGAFTAAGLEQRDDRPRAFAGVKVERIDLYPLTGVGPPPHRAHAPKVTVSFVIVDAITRDRTERQAITVPVYNVFAITPFTPEQEDEHLKKMAAEYRGPLRR